MQQTDSRFNNIFSLNSVFMGWGSGEFEFFDEVEDLIDKDIRRRKKARIRLIKEYKSGYQSRGILVKLMNAVLAHEFHSSESNRDIEKVFNHHRRNVPDFGKSCVLSDGKEFDKVNMITFRKYCALSTEDQKIISNWVKHGHPEKWDEKLERLNESK